MSRRIPLGRVASPEEIKGLALFLGRAGFGLHYRRADSHRWWRGARKLTRSDDPWVGRNIITPADRRRSWSQGHPERPPPWS